MEDNPKQRIAAVLSCPALGWNDHWGKIQQALAPWHIPVRLAYGAYWHQSMQGLLEGCVRDGCDLILTLDYDSIFESWHFARLLQSFVSMPEADAMAALQLRRGSIEQPLFSIKEWPDEKMEITGAPIKVHSAHFGMTLIRVEALKKVLKPWFVAIPDSEGSYGDGRVDADINFWIKWAETGNSLYVDPICNIGHLQIMVSELIQVGSEIVPVHTHVRDWRKREYPEVKV